MAFDPYQNEETVAEVRHHWDGPYHFGAPDGVAVNVTKEKIWVPTECSPVTPTTAPPQFNFDNGQLVVPHPPTSREEIQGAVYPRRRDPAGGVLPRGISANDAVRLARRRRPRGPS